MNFDSVRESAQNLVERQHAERTAQQKIPKSVVGPAVGGFKRPEALEYHILKLSNIPPGPSRADILVRISPTQTLDIVFPFEPAEVRNICIGVRDLAMTKGDRVAVATLCHYLVWMMASSRFPQEKLTLGVRTTWEHVLQQMSEEYDYPLPSLKVAVKELQERQTQDLARRP